MGGRDFARFYVLPETILLRPARDLMVGHSVRAGRNQLQFYPSGQECSGPRKTKVERARIKVSVKTGLSKTGPLQVG